MLAEAAGRIDHWHVVDAGPEEDEGTFTDREWAAHFDDRAEGELCRILGAATGKKILGFCHGVDDRLLFLGSYRGKKPQEVGTDSKEVS